MASGTKIKKKILINLRLLQQRYTGVQGYTYNLVKALLKDGYDYEFGLLTLSYNDDNDFIKDLLSYPNAKLVNIKSPRNKFIGNLFDIFFVNFVIKDYDLYFSPVNILPFFKFKNIPYVVGVLDLCTFVVPETTTKELKLYYDLYLGTSLKRADKIITISESAKDDLIRLFKVDESIVETVLLGIDEDYYHIKASKRKDCKILKEMNLVDSPYFLVIGTAKRKNLENTLSAFSLFRKKYPKSKLAVVVNNRSMEDYIRKCAEERDVPESSFSLAGKYLTDEELKNLYKHAVAFVFCPYYEGFGLPILESMQNECPVITSNISSMPEVSGDAAILVDPKSPEEMEHAMSEFYLNEDMREDYIQRGLKNAQNYKWEFTSKKLLNIFDKLQK